MNAPAKIPAVATTPHRPRAAPLSARIAGVTPGLAEVASEPGKTRIHLTASEYKLIRDVRALNDATNALLQAVIRSGGKWSTNALLANIEAAKAAQAIWADGLAEEIDNTEVELPDLPVEREFDPSRVHPDDPCQSKGVV